MKLTPSLLAFALSAAALAGCTEAKSPGQLVAENPADPGHRTMNEFNAKVSNLEPGPRNDVFEREYKGKTLEITGRVEVKLTASIAFSVPPEQHMVWGTFAASDRDRAFALEPGAFVRIRGTMVETIERNSVSLDQATIVAVY